MPLYRGHGLLVPTFHAYHGLEYHHSVWSVARLNCLEMLTHWRAGERAHGSGQALRMTTPSKSSRQCQILTSFFPKQKFSDLCTQAKSPALSRDQARHKEGPRLESRLARLYGECQRLRSHISTKSIFPSCSTYCICRWERWGGV